MIAFVKSPVVAAILVFVIALAAGSYIAGPETCLDGWNSPSIGRPGACSWHGGVTYKWLFTFATSLLCSGLTYAIVKPRYKMSDDLRRRLETEIEEAEQRISWVNAELDRRYFKCPECQRYNTKPADYRDGTICTECIGYPRIKRNIQ